MAQENRRRRGLAVLMWILYSYLSIYVPKTVFVLVDLLASIPRLWKRRRVKCVTRAAWLCSLAVFGLMWWGALVNRFRIDVNEVEIVRSDLPAAFDGFTIAQIPTSMWAHMAPTLHMSARW